MFGSSIVFSKYCGKQVLCVASIVCSKYCGMQDCGEPVLWEASTVVASFGIQLSGWHNLVVASTVIASTVVASIVVASIVVASIVGCQYCGS